MEPEKMEPGQRVFSVRMQGREVLKDLDIAKEAGGALRGLVKEFAGVEVNGHLTIDLVPTRGPSILCGIEAVAEEKR